MHRTAWIVTAAALALVACNGDKTSSNAASAQANGAAATADKTASAALGDGRFAQAVRAAGYERTLEGVGPYTILKPSDAAFDALPAGRLDALLAPTGKRDLNALLTTHIIPGTMLSGDIGAAIDRGNGKATLATFGGATLTATRDGEAVVLTDSAGTRARLAGNELRVSNGVIHSIDAVLHAPERQ